MGNFWYYQLKYIMTKVIVRRVKLDFRNIFKSVVCLLCLAVAVYGASVIAKKDSLEGLCQWETSRKDEVQLHDLAEFALMFGIAIIINWITLPLMIFVLYLHMKSARLYHKERSHGFDIECFLVENFIQSLFGYLIPFTTTMIVLGSTVGQKQFSEDVSYCHFTQNNGVLWLAVAIIPSIIPVLFYAIVTSFSVLYLVFFLCRIVASVFVNSFSKKQFLCCYVVEELEVV